MRKILVLALAALLAGCLRDSPVAHPPVWSPDGQKLYHTVVHPDGRFAIRILDLAAGRADDVTALRFADPVAALAPSPRGDRIALALVSGKGLGQPRLSLHVLTPDGSADKAVWQAPTEQGVADLCWTPDGRAILVAADRPGGRSGLWQVAADGTREDCLAADLTEIRSPAVSPDGRRVAFVARPEVQAPWSLYVLASDARGRRLVAQALFRRYQPGFGPAWSPTGEALAYVAERFLSEGFAEIWLWEPAKGLRTLARTAAGACLAPAWSPKGDAVAFVRFPFGIGPRGPGSEGRPADIVVADVEGKSNRALVADGLANLMPAWSPDGAAIAFHTCAGPAPEPHVVRLVDLGTGTLRLAHDDAAGRFALAWAGHVRGSKVALAQATGEVAEIRDPAMAAYAHLRIAQAAARDANWAVTQEHAGKAAAAPQAATRLPALRLLATAQMRLGDPKGALEAARLLAAGAADNTARQLAEQLRKGTEEAAEAEAELAAHRAPAPLHRLADAHLYRLGNPLKAIELYFRLLNDFPEYAGTGRAAASVFTCNELLGAGAASHRVLERAAAILGEASLTPEQALLLAEAAAANGQPEAALRWLDRLPKEASTAPTPSASQQDAGAAREDRAAQVRIRAGQQFLACAGSAQALAAFERAARASGSGAHAARASLEAAKLLVDDGRHGLATRHLVRALSPQADPPTVRDALRLLTAGRLRHRDPPSYETARVGELLAFGFVESAALLGEQLLPTLVEGDPRRNDLRTYLAAAFERLVDYHLARKELPQAHSVLERWLRRASREADMPRALLALATCQRLGGDRQGLAETLSRLVAEFPQRPEAAEARRQLLLLNTQP